MRHIVTTTNINQRETQDSRECVYCGNPRPISSVVSRRESAWSFIFKILSHSRSQTYDLGGPIDVTCNICNRMYQLTANSSHQDHLKFLFNKIHHTDTALASMGSIGLDLSGIEDQLIGCALPLAPKEIKGEMHLIFNMGEKRGYFCCRKQKSPVTGEFILLALSVRRV